jgi:hypothetical protein
MEVMNLRIWILPLLLVVSQGALAAAQTAGEHWCEDLQLRCTEKASADQVALEPPAFIAQLGKLDPHRFLPPELADYVLKCQQARDAKDLPQLALLHSSAQAAYFKDMIQDVQIIPHKLIPAAQFGALRVRVVSDCKGTHLQVGEGTTPAVLKRAFEELAMLKLAHRIPSGETIGETVSAHSCDLGTGHLRVKARPDESSWTLESGPRGVFVREGQEHLPQAFVDRQCVDRAVQYAKTHPKKSGVNVPPLPTERVAPSGGNAALLGGGIIGASGNPQLRPNVGNPAGTAPSRH